MRYELGDGGGLSSDIVTVCRLEGRDWLDKSPNCMNILIIRHTS